LSHFDTIPAWERQTDGQTYYSSAQQAMRMCCKNYTVKEVSLQVWKLIAEDITKQHDILTLMTTAPDQQERIDHW